MASSVERDELKYDGGEGEPDGPLAESMTVDEWLYERDTELREFSYWVMRTQHVDKLDEARWDELFCEWLEGR